MSVRIIPRLDIKGSNLVKGVHLEGLRVLGKPGFFAKSYYLMGADELIYMDVVASLYGRNSLRHIVESTAKEIFIPLTVGGGLRSLKDIQEILRAGADKVSLNTAAIENPELVRDASRAFGSSTVVVSIEAKKKGPGIYECYTDNGRGPTGVDVIEWVKKVEGLGAGEILLTSIDQEGTGKGYDIELSKAICKSVSIPVIVSGGAGTLEHIAKGISDGNADAVAIASMLHYGVYRKHEKELSAFEGGNLNFFKSGESFSRVEERSISEIKSHLQKNGIKATEHCFV